MDMSKFNDEIRQASDEPVDDGPRYPDGDYIMAVVEHEEKTKGEPDINGDYRQIGYYGLRHPTSKACVRYGQSGLKNLYKSVNFMPVEFTGIYGKRFIASLESKKQDDTEFPWSTEITGASSRSKHNQPGRANFRWPSGEPSRHWQAKHRQYTFLVFSQRQRLGGGGNTPVFKY